MVRRATCCCGSASITLQGDPVLNAVCHCNDCKRRTGSAFGWNAYFSDDQVLERTGETVAYVPPRDTSQSRARCSQCGTTLYWVSGGFPEHTGVSGGAFTDPSLPAPTITAQDETRCAWIDRPDGWTDFSGSG